MSNHIEATNVNPKIWGPIFWAVLHTIARYPQKNIDKRDLVLFVSTIPYVLPCSECSAHCREIYSRLKLISNVPFYNFKKWVWILRSEVNKYTNTPNTSYENYIQQNSIKYVINKRQIVELMGMISMNYPHENTRESRLKRYMTFLFIQLLIKFMSYIPELSSISKYRAIYVWNNRLELQNWLRHYCRSVYRFEITFDYI